MLQQQGQNLGMYVSMHWGNFRITRVGIKRKIKCKNKERSKNVYMSDDVCFKESEPKREKLSPWRLDQK